MIKAAFGTMITNEDNSNLRRNNGNKNPSSKESFNSIFTKVTLLDKKVNSGGSTKTDTAEKPTKKSAGLTEVELKDLLESNDMKAVGLNELDILKLLQVVNLNGKGFAKQLDTKVETIDEASLKEKINSLKILLGSELSLSKLSSSKKKSSDNNNSQFRTDQTLDNSIADFLTKNNLDDYEGKIAKSDFQKGLSNHMHNNLDDKNIRASIFADDSNSLEGLRELLKELKLTKNDLELKMTSIDQKKISDLVKEAIKAEYNIKDNHLSGNKNNNHLDHLASRNQSDQSLKGKVSANSNLNELVEVLSKLDNISMKKFQGISGNDFRTQQSRLLQLQLALSNKSPEEIGNKLTSKQDSNQVNILGDLVNLKKKAGTSKKTGTSKKAAVNEPIFIAKNRDIAKLQTAVKNEIDPIYLDQKSKSGQQTAGKQGENILFKAKESSDSKQIKGDQLKTSIFSARKSASDNLQISKDFKKMPLENTLDKEVADNKQAKVTNLKAEPNKISEPSSKNFNSLLFSQEDKGNKGFGENLVASKPKESNEKSLNSLAGEYSQIKENTIKNNPVKMKQTSNTQQNDIYDQVAKNLESFRRIGKNRIEIQLEPESLGKVKLNLKVEDGRVSVQFKVDSSLVKGQLEQSIHLLKKNFLKQGYNVDHIQVETNNHDTAFRQQGNPQQQQQQNGQQGQQHSNYDGMTAEELYQLFLKEEELEMDIFSYYKQQKYGDFQKLNYLA